MKDINDRPIKLGQTVKHFFNGDWYIETVGWTYDSIRQRRKWVYKPSGLSVKYSTLRHWDSMATARKQIMVSVPNPNRKRWQLWKRSSVLEIHTGDYASPEII